VDGHPSAGGPGFTLTAFTAEDAAAEPTAATAEPTTETAKTEPTTETTTFMLPAETAITEVDPAPVPETSQTNRTRDGAGHS
jgi:hypothetical protein